MYKYLLLALLSACSSGGWTPHGPQAPTLTPTPPNRPLPPQYERSQYELKWESITPHGLRVVDPGWQGLAAYDFDAGRPRVNYVDFLARLRSTRAQNAIYGLTLTADAMPRPAKACNLAGQVGDEMADQRAGHSGTICVPWALSVWTPAWQSSEMRTEPAVAITMPAEHSYQIDGDTVTLRVQLAGSAYFAIDDVHMYVDEVKP